MKIRKIYLIEGKYVYKNLKPASENQIVLNKLSDCFIGDSGDRTFDLLQEVIDRNSKKWKKVLR